MEKNVDLPRIESSRLNNPSLNNSTIGKQPRNNSTAHSKKHSQNNSKISSIRNTPQGLPINSHNYVSSPYQYKYISSPVTDRYQDAYSHINQANNLIQKRMNRLQEESKLLKSFGGSIMPYNRDANSLYNMRDNIMRQKNQLMNPNLYANQYIDPIYFPLEMPVNAEPISLPKIEIGLPMNDAPVECQCNNGMGITDILVLLQALQKPEEEPEVVEYEPDPIIQYESDDDNKRRKKKHKEKPFRAIKRDWWKFAKAFVTMYKFYKVSERYGKHSKVRNPLISDMTNSVLPHLDSIKSWVLGCMNSFLREMQIFPDLDLQFHNHSGKLKIQAQSQKIMAILKILLIELAKKSTSINDLPIKLQELLYKYIREKAYYPKKFLTSFIVNRLDFNFYGGTKNTTEPQVGMMIAFMIISKTIVQQVLLHPKENFEQFQNFRNIEISCKYLASILHYLTRDAFYTMPAMIKELLALLNYYRNYHIYNEQVEKQHDVFNNNMVFRDQDEISRDLVPESSMTEFFNLNSRWCAQMKALISQWGTNLARQVKSKYSRRDMNLRDKKLDKPSDNPHEDYKLV